MCIVYVCCHVGVHEHLCTHACMHIAHTAKAAPAGDAKKEEPSHATMDVEQDCMILHAVLNFSRAAMLLPSPTLHMQDPSGGTIGDTAKDCLRALHLSWGNRLYNSYIYIYI